MSQWEPDLDIRGKIVLVTGASQGIGAATALEFAKGGAQLVLLARTQSKLDEVVSEIQSMKGAANAYAVDLSDAEATKVVCEKVIEEIGVPDVILNNAGAGRWLFVDETSPEEAVHMMALPYFAAFYITHFFMPEMLKQNRGMIVNVNSPISRTVWPGSVGYASARWALRGFTEAIRSDVTGTKLKVLEVIPAEVDNSYFVNNPGAKERVPGIGKFLKTCTSEETAEFIVNAIKQETKVAVMTIRMKVLFGMLPFTGSLINRIAAKTGYTYVKHQSS